MTNAAKVAWDDTILPFQLDNADVRGRVGRLDGVLDTILDQHDYPAQVAALVAEAAVLTALIGQTIKLRWKLSLQIRGDGPIRIIATDYYGPKADGEPAQIRAYASYDAERLADASGTPFEKLGAGMFAVLLDQGDGTEPYQGITGLTGGSLASCAEAYFDQSEQIPTRFALGIAQAVEKGRTNWRAGGVMLQHLPSPDPDPDNWNRATTLLDSVELTELIGPHVSPDQLLVRLFHEESPRVFDPQPVRFGCTCGPEKVKQAMSIYSAKDIAHMTTTEGKVTADCQFCGSHYAFDPDELGFEAKS